MWRNAVMLISVSITAARIMLRVNVSKTSLFILKAGKSWYTCFYQFIAVWGIVWFSISWNHSNGQAKNEIIMVTRNAFFRFMKPLWIYGKITIKTKLSTSIQLHFAHSCYMYVRHSQRDWKILGSYLSLITHWYILQPSG